MTARKAAAALLLAAALWPRPAPAGAVTEVELRGVDAIKALYDHGNYGDARRFCYYQLWKDINQPEALYYLTRSLEKLGEKDEAAVFCHIMLRVLDEHPESKAHPRAASRRALCTAALKRLDGLYRADCNTYVQGALHKKFASPTDVDDLWMTQVKCDLRGLHGLYAWKLVGGRKDAKPDWSHNTQGAMHRSAAKYMADVHGRRGVLFCIPSKKSRRLSRVVWTGPVRGKVLRVGTRAYGFPYVLNVVVGDRTIRSQTIGKDAWADLRVPLDVEGGVDEPVVLELVIPEEQRWMEGLFLDYIDFFDD